MPSWLSGWACHGCTYTIKGGYFVLPPFFFCIFFSKYPYTVPFYLLVQLPLFSQVDLVIHDQDDRSRFQSSFSLSVVQL